MASKFNILVFGASYGSLLGTKLGLAGHNTHLICLPAEADLINSEGAVVRMPVKGREGLVEVNSKNLPGKITAGGPQGVDPSKYDLVALAMQEPQYRSAGRARAARRGRESQGAVHVDHEHAAAALPRAHSGRRCQSVPRLLHRSHGLGQLRSGAHDALQPGPAGIPPAGGQSQRAAGAAADQFQIGALRFERAHRDPAPARPRISKPPASTPAASKIELPVKLKVHESVFVPLAKWSMLIAGNYRCVQKDAARSIKEAVHSDIETSRAVYNWVVKLCTSLGAIAERSRALREIRSGGALAGHAVLGGARAICRRTLYRARRSPGADHRSAKRASAMRRSTRRWRWSTRDWR